MATKWSTKWSTTVDPVEWSVDEVVSFLCDPTDTPWLPSSKSPRPDSTKLEAALRANDVCGEILLALDIETAKSLGLESLGQRMTLLKAVTWLKAQKSKELDEAPVGRLPHSPQTTITNATSPEPDNKPPKKVPRRLAPTIVTEGPPEANMVNAVKQGSNEFQKSGTREEAFFKLLLERWPPEAVDGDSPNLGLELYGDSDSEEELDPETWKEVLIENPHLQSAFGKPEHGSTGGPKVLSREICEKIIQFHIVSEEYAWCQKNLTGLSSELDPVWSDLRASNKIDAKKATFETSVAAFDTRLEKLKAAHLDGTFKSTKQLQKLCGSLDPTISNLSEVRWVLKLISTDNPPSKVALEHFKKSLEPPKPNDFGLEEDSEGQADSESELGGESLDSQLEDENPSRGSVDTAPFEAELTPHPQTNTETVKSTASESSDLIPLEDPFEYLEERSFTSLEQEQNKHDILAKLIMELNEEETEQIATLLDDLLPFIFLERAQRGLKRMLDNRDTGPSKDLERRSFMRVSALYLAWHTCHGINDTGIDRKLIEDTFRTIANKDESPAFNEFFDELKSLMEARRIRSGGRPRSNSQNTQNTSSTQSEADTDPIIISSKNPQTPIFLNSEIAKYIKSHQVEGIQFMWRELCESETPQGCLLAHEMGLGKTMQV